MRVQKLRLLAYTFYFRMCEAISDFFQGLFQRHERLDIAGKSMTIRYFFSARFFCWHFCLLQSH